MIWNEPPRASTCRRNLGDDPRHQIGIFLVFDRIGDARTCDPHGGQCWCPLPRSGLHIQHSFEHLAIGSRARLPWHAPPIDLLFACVFAAQISPEQPPHERSNARPPLTLTSTASPAGAPHRDPSWCRGWPPITDDVICGTGLCWFRAQPERSWHHQGIDPAAANAMPGVLGSFTGVGSCRLRHAKCSCRSRTRRFGD